MKYENVEMTHKEVADLAHKKGFELGFKAGYEQAKKDHTMRKLPTVPATKPGGCPWPHWDEKKYE